MSDPFEKSHTPVAGQVEQLAEDVRAVTAPNPSPMTYTGTRSYLVGNGKLALIDPGPDDPVHHRALVQALRPGEEITHILVTHAHLDHSPLADRLSDETGAKVYGFGPAHAGRSDVMARLSETGGLGGGEGIDAGFDPDVEMSHGDVLEGNGWALETIHTPGHLSNHLCFRLRDAVFSGDHVMGWASSLVSPPDGDLTDFMASLRILQGAWDRVYFPGHGAPVRDPGRLVGHLIAHRQEREAQILHALSARALTPAEITADLYRDVPEYMHPAAMRNVLAHLIDLTVREEVAPVADLTADAAFRRLSRAAP